MLLTVPLHGQKPAARLTIADLVRLEPELARLLALARRCKDDGRDDYYCRDLASVVFRRQIRRMVGFLRERPGPEVLFTSQSYDVVYETVFRSLPRCRSFCGCGGSAR